MKHFKRFFDGPKTPLVVDRRFDIYFIIKWGIYVSWAISSALEQIASPNSIFDDVYQFAWSGAVGTTALVAMMFAIMGFIPTPMARVTKEKMEMYALIILSGFVFVYPCIIIYNEIVLHHPFVTTSFILSIFYMTPPLYRIMYLWGRIKSNV